MSLLDKIKLIFISKDTEIDNLKAQIKEANRKNEFLNHVINSKDLECSIWKKQVEELTKELDNMVDEIKAARNKAGYYQQEYQNLKGSQR